MTVPRKAALLALVIAAMAGLASDMAYATRHDTVEAVTVTVYGMDSAAAVIQPTAVLAQHTFRTSDLAAGSH